MLGIFIGIAALVALVSLSQGLEVAILEQFDEIGADKIFIQPKGAFAGLESDVVSFTEEDKKGLARVVGISEVAGLTYKSGLISLDDENIPVGISGIPDDDTKELYIELNTLDLEQGRLFRKADPSKVVIGNDFARNELLDRRVKLGDKVEINGKEFEVVGIWERTGDPVLDKTAFMSDAAMKDLLDLTDDENGWLIARINPGTDISLVKERIERSLRRTRDLEIGKEDFEVSSPEDILAQLGTILGIVQTVLVGIAAISLLVGGIGITNTMFTSVLERTKEVGLMKAVGATNGDVLYLFLVEAGLLGAAGGIVGVLLGMGISKIVELVGTIVLGTPLLKAVFPFYLIIGGILFSFVVGVISGIFPAYRAAKMQPVEALRS
jgi:putative ABC transport system permease protein